MSVCAVPHTWSVGDVQLRAGTRMSNAGDFFDGFTNSLFPLAIIFLLPFSFSGQTSAHINLFLFTIYIFIFIYDLYIFFLDSDGAARVPRALCRCAGPTRAGAGQPDHPSHRPGREPPVRRARAEPPVSLNPVMVIRGSSLRLTRPSVNPGRAEGGVPADSVQVRLASPTTASARLRATGGPARADSEGSGLRAAPGPGPRLSGSESAEGSGGRPGGGRRRRHGSYALTLSRSPP
jgi:hypothetical protein